MAVVVSCLLPAALLHLSLSLSPADPQPHPSTRLPVLLSCLRTSIIAFNWCVYLSLSVCL